MSESTHCQRCGGLLPQIGGLLGRCPECMFELGFESAAERAGDVADDGEFPASIGRYRILRLIGQGGMGAVYEAEQEQPSRIVALKIIKHGMASPALIRRFEQETEALGRLQHPGIAQIYEAGTVDTGFGLQPYFAMELIRGSSPLEYAETHHLGTRERLEIMAKICEAVHHAHQRGLIHRDLKPANILVDQSGQPKVLDFGVARVTDSDSRATMQTDVGQLVGTLAYMSPEQVLADPLDIDTRSDVYALGVVFYELLAGRLPYDISKKIHEAVQTIRDRDPQRLSAWNRTYSGDIETIAAKALEKDRTRRYESAAEMAADIRRYLTDRPIVARPQSAVYHFRKFARRNRALVVASEVVLLILIAAVTVSTLLALQAVSQRNRAKESEWESVDARLKETEQRQRAEAALVRADTQTLAAQQALAQAELNLYHNNIDLADREWSDANILRSDELLKEVPSHLRNWEWSYLARRNHAEDATLAGHLGPIGALAFIEGGRRLRTVSPDGTFKDWDLETGKQVATGNFGPTIYDSQIEVELDLTPDGRILSFQSRPVFGGLVVHRVWDLFTGREVFSFSGNSFTSDARDISGYSLVNLSPDGKRLVAAFYLDRGGSAVRAWDLENRKQSTLGVSALPPAESIVLSPNGAMLAMIRNSVVDIVSATTGEAVITLGSLQGAITSLAFSLDGAVVVAGSQNQSVMAWRTVDGTILWAAPIGTARNLAFSPDSALVAIGLADRTIRVLDSKTGRQVSRLSGHTDTIHALRFTPNGKQLVSAGDDKLVHIWNLGPSEFHLNLDSGNLVAPVQVASDGNTILTTTSAGSKLWDVNTGQLRLDLPANATQSGSGLNRDASRIALTESDLSSVYLKVTDIHAGREIRTFRLTGLRLGNPEEKVTGPDHSIVMMRPANWRIGDPQMSPTGDRAALLSMDTSSPPKSRQTHLNILEVAAGKRISGPRFENILVGPFRFSPDGKQIAILVEKKSNDSGPSYLEIYDATTGRRLQRFPVSKVTAYPVLAFSANGNQLAEAVDGKTLTIWDTRTGAKIISFPRFGNGVADAAFSPDGSRLVSVSSAGEIWLWDSQAGKALIPLKESGGNYSLKEVMIVSVPNEAMTPAKERVVSFDQSGRMITMTSVTLDPKGVKVRISTWDGSPRQ